MKESSTIKFCEPRVLGPLDFDFVKMKNMIHLLILSMITSLLRGVEFEHPHVRPEWVIEELTLDQGLKKVRKEQAEEVRKFTEMQLDPENVWVIHGVKGTGPMPWKFYTKEVNKMLEDPTYLQHIRDGFEKGWVLYSYSTPEEFWEGLHGSKGYVFIKNGKVQLWIETGMN